MNNTTPSATAQRLKGKVAIITGGASGFGKSTAKLFVEHGAKVTITDIQDDQGVSLCNEIIASITTNAKHQDTDNNHHHDHDIISYVHCDVSNEEDVKNLVDHTISKHGKLDIMFNNAGIIGENNRSILENTAENFKKVFETNVYGGFLGAKYAAKVMIPRKFGVILFTASVAIGIASETPHAYAISKHGIVGFMKNLCVEMGGYGIRVNAISPTSFSTPLTLNYHKEIDKEVLDEVITTSNVLKGVTPHPLDVAYATLFLASDEARFVSGVNLFLDGGASITNPCFSNALQKNIISLFKCSIDSSCIPFSFLLNATDHFTSILNNKFKFVNE